MKISFFTLLESLAHVQSFHSPSSLCIFFSSLLSPFGILLALRQVMGDCRLEMKNEALFLDFFEVP